MRERPIPYSAPMVRARREGRKTQTRRAIARPLANPGWTSYVYFGPSVNNPTCQSKAIECGPDYPDGKEDVVLCPYGAAGDRLWVREVWRTLAIYNDLPPKDLPRTAPIWYEADGKAPAEFGGGRYRHGRFMMRWMSRGLDEITEIRVERVNDISEADAKAEGCEPGLQHVKKCHGWTPYVLGYSLLWDKINGGIGPCSWRSNPWVWVVEFKVQKS